MMARRYGKPAYLRYLASRYGNEPFWPQDLGRRTRVDMWAEWSKINVALKFTAPVFWRVVRTAAKDQDKQAINEAVYNLASVLDIAETRLSLHSYLVSDDFTLADIQFGHLLYRYYDIKIQRPDLPHLWEYYQRLTCRPAYEKHVMISYEELRVL